MKLIMSALFFSFQFAFASKNEFSTLFKESTDDSLDTVLIF